MHLSHAERERSAAAARRHPEGVLEQGYGREDRCMYVPARIPAGTPPCPLSIPAGYASLPSLQALHQNLHWEVMNAA